MRCPNCQSTNKDSAKFCIECGYPLHAGHGAKAPEADAARPEGAAGRAGAEGSRAAVAPESPASVIGASLDEVRALREEPAEVSADAEVFARLIADNARRAADAEDLPRYGERRRGAAEAPQDEGAADAAPRAAAARATADEADFEFEFVEELPVAGSAPAAEAPAEPAAAALASEAAETALLDGVPTPAAGTPDDDFGAFDEALYAPREGQDGRDSLAEVVHEMFPDGVVAAGAAGAARTADLTGLERLVDSSYVPPSYASRAGDTMELPAVGDGPAAAAKRFSAEMDPKEARRQARAQRKLDRQIAREQRRGAADGPRPARSKTPLIVVACLVVAAVAAAGITWYLQLWGGKVVPDVVGKSQADATYVLTDKGFSVRALPVRSDDVEGIVLLTDPDAGRRAEEGTEVVIHVSVARMVPAVLGLPRADAEAAFAEEGLTAVTYEEVKSNDPEGTVIGVTPEAGTKVKAATPVTVQVAVPFTVPDVDGLSRADAEAALEAEGYGVEVRTTYTEEVPEGTAVSTEPAAGSQLDSGSTVVLNVAKSRKAECLAYAQTYFQSSKHFSIGGKNYEIDPAKLSVEYVGDDTVRYSVSGIEYASVFGIVVRNDAAGWQTLTGTITWDAEGNVKSSDPAIKRV